MGLNITMSVACLAWAKSLPLAGSVGLNLIAALSGSGGFVAPPRGERGFECGLSAGRPRGDQSLPLAGSVGLNSSLRSRAADLSGAPPRGERGFEWVAEQVAGDQIGSLPLAGSVGLNYCHPREPHVAHQSLPLAGSVGLNNRGSG